MASRRETRFLEFTAYHEAGHATAAVLLGRWVVRARVFHRGLGVGGVLCGRDPSLDPRRRKGRWRARRMIHREVMILFAGLIAESIARGRRHFEGAHGDGRKIETLLWRLTEDADERLAIGRELAMQTHHLLLRHWSAVRRVARALLAERLISGARVRAVVLGRPKPSRGVSRVAEASPRRPTPARKARCGRTR